MSGSMSSIVLLEVTTEENNKYSMNIPIGARYEDAFKALDMFKQSVEQMQENAKKIHEENQKKQEETKDKE